VAVVLDTLILVLVLGGVTLLINYAERERTRAESRPEVYQVLRGIVILTVLVLNAGFVLLTLSNLLVPIEKPDIALQADSVPLVGEPLFEARRLIGSEDLELSSENKIGAIAVTLTVVALNTLFLWTPFRRVMANFFVKPGFERPRDPFRAIRQAFFGPDPQPAVEVPPLAVGFQPESLVHMWGFVVVFYFVGSQVAYYFLASGLEGVAAGIGVSYLSLSLNFIPQLLIPLLGVGLLVRRDPRAIMRRLGLTFPSIIDIGVAGIATALLIGLVIVVGTIWMLSVSPETYQEQTEASEALAASVTTLGLAFMVAFTAGVGEELAFRGVLQPIFGFWFTAFVFVLGHTQYTLTPASLIILSVAIGFGLLRKYFSTTTAIMAHFLYNFTLLVLSLAAGEVGLLG
jgi:membrane protease YdiL (CAAX protease family)